MTGFSAIIFLMAALGSLGPPQAIFFDFPATPPLTVQVVTASPPQLPSLYERRHFAYERAVSFIRVEKFAEALTFIRKQTTEIRSWPGLASLEAGLIQFSNAQEALVIYERILDAKVRDRYWARALSGYRFLLKTLSDGGDYSARSRLINCLVKEWRNQEALSLIEDTLAENLVKPVREEIEASIPVLALRIGDYDRASQYWEGRSDVVSLRWLSIVRQRQGQFEEAARLRLKAAEASRGRRRLADQGQAFEIMVEGGLTGSARDLLQKEPSLKKTRPDWSTWLGLSSLVEGQPWAAADYFKADAELPGVAGQKALYFQGRALELAGEKGAKELFVKAAAGEFSYYRLLAAGRLDAQQRKTRRLALSMDMVVLLANPQGRESLGYYLWLSEKLPWPWPDLDKAKLPGSGPGEVPRARLAVAHYLRAGDKISALSELSSAADILVPARAAPLTDEMARWILLAAEGGDYRLAVRLMGRVREVPGSGFKKWSHPLVLGTPLLEAWRRYGLPPQLVLALIRTESAFQTEVVSASNARGLMQILPSTGSRIAVELGEIFKEEDLFYPEFNIRYGTWYLNKLLEAFGQVPLALAAYNGGPFNIKTFILARPDLPLDVFLETLPLTESSAYVRRILESTFIYEAAYLDRFNYPDLTGKIQVPKDSMPDF